MDDIFDNMDIVGQEGSNYGECSQTDQEQFAVANITDTDAPPSPTSFSITDVEFIAC